MKKIGRFISCILPVVYALIIQVVTSFIVLFAYGVMKGIALAEQGETDTIKIAKKVSEAIPQNIYFTSVAIAAVICILIFGIWYNRRFGNENTLRIKKVFTAKNITYILLLGLGLQVAITLILSTVVAIKPEWVKEYLELLTPFLEENSILTLCYMLLIAPISEEIIFRGVIFEKSKKNMPLFLANILQALLFGIFHMNLVQGIYTFALGIVLGIVCIKCRSLYAAMLLHIVFNLGGSFVGYIVTEEVLAMPLLVIAILLISIITIVFSIMKLPKLEKRMIYDIASNEKIVQLSD